MNIGILGTGKMGSTLGKIWAKLGHRIMFGSRDPERAKQLVQSLEGAIRGGSYSEAVRFGEAVLLSVPWQAAKKSIHSAGPFEGKILIDCTNPIGSGPVFLPEVGHTTSAAEEIARWAEGARVVKAFHDIFWRNLERPQFGDQRATLFYCGDDAAAKKAVAKLGEATGFETVDAGPLLNARLIEPLAFLWMHLAGRGNLGRDFAIGILRRK